MYIDTNKPKYDCPQDDEHDENESWYGRLKQEKHELSANRLYKRKCKTWSWPLEIEYRDEIDHLNIVIQAWIGIH